ncbi:MAG: hypothetical protein HFACDABA_01746 [Anaerolineales bacterium]|nr:hypothetical protein [Anaerolineales bacterium]
MGQSEFDSLKARLIELEERVKYLYHKMNVDYAEGDLKTSDVRIRELLLQKRRPEAITMYAVLHNVDQEKARQAIDAIDKVIGA